SYGGGGSAPNLTAKPDFKNKRMVWYQHFDFDTSARALVNRAGALVVDVDVQRRHLHVHTQQRRVHVVQLPAVRRR
ncbi:hypothetical protein KBZ21_41435, partial [Streptomyces sp. A73]|nr:hypothetical protein [Streptomyces sp. A73]